MVIVSEYKKFFGEVNSVSEMVNWVIDLLKQGNMSKKIMADVKTAIVEALANIFRHAYKDEAVKPVKIKVMVDTEKALISLRDFGRKFDISNYMPPDLSKASSGDHGIFMMRKLMDGVQYFPQEIGTELLMWKSLTDEAPPWLD